MVHFSLIFSIVFLRFYKRSEAFMPMQYTASFQSRWDIIKCEYGAEIVFVPDI